MSDAELYSCLSWSATISKQLQDMITNVVSSYKKTWTLLLTFTRSLTSSNTCTPLKFQHTHTLTEKVVDPLLGVYINLRKSMTFIAPDLTHIPTGDCWNHTSIVLCVSFVWQSILTAWVNFKWPRLPYFLWRTENLSKQTSLLMTSRQRECR